MTEAPRRRASARVLALLLAALASMAAAAQNSADFDLPAQPLAASLREVAARTNSNILFDRALVAGRVARALRVHATLEQALALLLDDTGLAYRFLDENTVAVVALSVPKPQSRARPPSAAPASQPLGSDTEARPAPGGAPLTQPAAGNTDEQSTGLEEIIVTAERRSESAQNVAASVTAFTPEMLEKSEVWNVSDLQLRTPGLLVSSNGAYGQPYLRGVGSDIINPGADSPVAIFIDGAYQARQTAALTDFFDVERVEVLKGPQGALYGRNATGGAINLVTHDPELLPAAEGDAVYGSYATRRVRAMANIPLGDDAALRIAGLVSRRDGYTRNLFNGRRLNDENIDGIRAKFKYGFTTGFSFVVAAEYARENDSRNVDNKVIDTPALPLPVRDLAPQLGYVAPLIPADPFVVKYNSRPNIDLEQTRLNVTARWQFGRFELESSSAYTHVQDVSVNDLDGTQIDFSYDREAERSRTFTQTVQLSSPESARAHWIAGLEYLHETGGQDFDARLPLFGPAAAVALGPDSPVAGFVWNSSLRTRAAAGFADGSLALSEHFTATAGMRYSWEEKTADFLQTVLDPRGLLTGTPGTTLTPARPERAFSAWTPKARLEYRPAAGILAYASAIRGFKSGGFNLMNRGEVFQPEKLWSFETGLKASWLANRLRTNAAAFYYDYRDLQVNQFSGVTNLVTNAANSKITGVELELLGKPVAAVGLDLSVAWLDAQYRSYLTRDANEPQVTLDLSGNRMPHAPRKTVTAGVEWSLPLAAAGRVTLRGETRYQSLIYFDQFDTPQLTQGGYMLYDARLSFEPRSQHWSVAVFGANLGDKTYRQSMVRVDNVFGTLATFGAPRTCGIEVATHF